MKLKKFNAVLTLLCIALAIDHCSSMAFTLFGKKPFNETPHPLAIAFAAVLSVHALVSICIFLFSHSEAGRLYPKANAQTIEQRISAILLIGFFHFHLSNRLVYPLGGNIKLFTTELLLLLALASHFGASAHRAFITLGIKSKVPNIVVRILLTIIEVADLAGLIYYNFIL